MRIIVLFGMAADPRVIVGIPAAVAATVALLASLRRTNRTRQQRHRGGSRRRLTAADIGVLRLLNDDLMNTLLVKSSAFELPLRQEVAVSAPLVGGARQGSSLKVGEVFDACAHRRLVLVGEAGAGKSVTLAMLEQDLLRRADQEPVIGPVPIRVNVSELVSQASPLEAVAETMGDSFGWTEAETRDALREGHLLIIVDGLDEVEARDSGIRVGNIIDGLNELTMVDVPVVLTCRAGEYRGISNPVVKNAVVMRVEPLQAAQAGRILGERAATAAMKSLSNVVADEPASALSQLLTKPFWLSTAVRLTTGNAAKLTVAELAARAGSGDLDDLLTADYADQLVRSMSVDDEKKARRYSTALAEIAVHLETTRQQTASPSTDDPTPVHGPSDVSGSGFALGADIVVHGLWRMVALKRVLAADVALAWAMALPFLIGVICTALRVGWLFAAAAALGSAVVLARAWQTARHEYFPPVRFNRKALLTRKSPLHHQAALLVLIIGVTVDQPGAALAAAVAVWAAVGLAIGGRGQALITSVEGVRPPGAALSDELTVSLLGAAAFFPICALGLGQWLPWWASAAVSAVYCGLVGLTVASAVWRRYVALLLCTRGTLPLRLRHFLRQAYAVGLLRQSGQAYQFRHLEFQRHFAQHEDSH